LVLERNWKKGWNQKESGVVFYGSGESKKAREKSGGEEDAAGFIK
jgi:hypothetical protein